MNNNWEIKTIGELCDLATGGTPSRVRKEYFDGGQIKWLVSGDIHQKEIYDCEGRITESGYTNSNAKYLPINSVLIALNGQGKTKGTVALLRVNATCNQSLVSIYPKDLSALLPEYLYRVLDGRYNEIRKMTGDAGNERRGLNMPLIRSIKIALPPLAEQKRIVKILDEKFGAIEELRKVTEQQIVDVKELFKSRSNETFVVQENVTGTSGLGEHIDFLSGPAFKSEKYTQKEDGVKLLRGDNIICKSFRWSGVKKWPIDDVEQYKKYYLSEGDVVLAMDRPFVGYGLKHNLVKSEDLPLLLVQRVARLRPKDELDKNYLMHLVASKNFTEYLLQGQTGVGVPHISKGQIESYQLVLPSLKNQKEIANELDMLLAKTMNLEIIFKRKTADLEELKKSYLEQAFSGNL